MSDQSCPSTQSCIEMWRNAVPRQQTNSHETARRLPSADTSRPPSALSSSDAPPPSILSDSDDVRPPSALSNSDAPPPSELSDDDLCAPSALSSDVRSVRHAMSAMSMASREHHGVMYHGHSRGDNGYYTRGLCLRASFSSTMSKNGSAVCLASERAVQQVVERERIQNYRVEEAREAAEGSLAKLLLLVAELRGSERQDDEHKVSFTQNVAASLESALGNSVSFHIGPHPEYRDPIRPGTPAVLPASLVDYFADDESESSTTSRRRKTRRSRKFPNVSLPNPAPSLSTPEPLQSPAYLLRALNPSEVWDEDAPVEPVLHAPVPLRPLREPELLLANHNERAHSRF